MRATLHFDGASRGNPGPSGGGALLRLPGGPRSIVRPLAWDATNNVAEYAGLLAGLDAAAAAGVTALDGFGDSELVVLQVLGRYRVRQPHLAPLHARAAALGRRFARFTLAAVPRAANAEADALARQAAEQAAAMPRGTYADLRRALAAGEDPLAR